MLQNIEWKRPLTMHSVEGAVSLIKHLSNRTISTSFVCFANHYETLGLNRSATFADIKAAYYKKSKECHPDLNVDDEEAAHRFRAITEAYKVLGNVHSKKLYDKGAVFKDRQFDSTENKFHKSRGKIVPSEGNFKIYDFDEWTQAHYSKAFVDKQRVKNAERKLNSFQVFSVKTSYEIYLLGCAAVFFLGTFVIFTLKKIDDDHLERKKRIAEKLKNDRV